MSAILFYYFNEQSQKNYASMKSSFSEKVFITLKNLAFEIHRIISNKKRSTRYFLDKIYISNQILGFLGWVGGGMDIYAPHLYQNNQVFWVFFDFLLSSTGGGCYAPWEGAVMVGKFGIKEAPLPELKNICPPIFIQRIKIIKFFVFFLTTVPTINVR